MGSTGRRTRRGHSSTVETLERALAARLDPGAALAANDSYGFFGALGDLLCCGPTGTNVMDIKMAVGLPSSQ